MCIIIIKKKGLRVSNDILKSSARINPHGLGIVWLDDYKVSYHKSNEFNVLNTSRPFIAHFRYATVGAVNKENTHPFVCGSNKNELLMMNGTIKGLGNLKKSDSKELAEILGEFPRHTWKEELERYDCRFVTMNTRNKSYQMYNREDWHKKDGIWYSKDNVLETNVVAVYGTLKKGYSNYWNYLSGKSRHLGKGKTTDKYPLVVKGLPYLINEKGKGYNVEVDVFKVSDSVLSALDRLEGHPIWYKREQINVTLKGKKVLCWTYFNIKETADGKEFQKSFVQRPFKSFTSSSFRLDTPILSDNYHTNLFNSKMNEETIEDDEFNVENESPICISCYNDLEFDGFEHYHCGQCCNWYTTNEILQYY
jgi:gamma-glutamylaminecyclotransferase